MVVISGRYQCVSGAKPRSGGAGHGASSMADKKKAHLEDTWSSQQVHTNFPQNAVRVTAQPNTYVALWYLHGTHVSNQFFYEWITLSAWKIVRCGAATPIFWKEKSLLGNYDLDTHKADFADGEKFLQVSDASALGHMLVLVRNMGGGPPGCSCPQCMIENKASKKALMVNDWGDFCCGGPWPTDKPVMKALNRALNTPRGPQEHFVSLWYRHGRPCMGRAWNSGGKIDASFVDDGREFTGHVIGSMQMLVELPATAAGFEYCWLPYEQASRYMDKDYAPVHLSYVAPCVIQVDAFEVLGKILNVGMRILCGAENVGRLVSSPQKEKISCKGSVNLKKERAEAAFDGHVTTLEGPKIQKLKVLCRKDRDDTMTI
ncbi:unnamed protein product [Nippostrongylus brasiliensis]|uniref:Glyco_hydro_59M domain-containing protein n=1 Tax=Nippostrongylus brasiliensis TaxID=27835 RepID=A0A0N4XC67_NIPBR|nr:unnamed protein product [Nippostrongylus brasiliensis]